MPKMKPGKKDLILLGSFFLSLLAGVAPAAGCPVLFQEPVRPQTVKLEAALSNQCAIRPQGAHSILVQSRLRERIGFTPAPAFDQVVFHAQEGASAPDEVDLGVLEPTGKTNPDGTEKWLPRDDSVLSGSVEVDVRDDGLIVRQKVLRQQRASSERVASSLKKKETQAPKPAPSLFSWLTALKDKLQTIAD